LVKPVKAKGINDDLDEIQDENEKKKLLKSNQPDKERITDNNGKDINFSRPNGDKLYDPFFVKTRNKIS
jgi:hypothetical protein